MTVTSTLTILLFIFSASVLAALATAKFRSRRGRRIFPVRSVFVSDIISYNSDYYDKLCEEIDKHIPIPSADKLTPRSAR